MTNDFIIAFEDKVIALRKELASFSLALQKEGKASPNNRNCLGTLGVNLNSLSIEALKLEELIIKARN